MSQVGVLAELLVQAGCDLDVATIEAKISEEVGPRELPALVSLFNDEPRAASEIPQDAPLVLHHLGAVLRRAGSTKPVAARCPRCNYRRELMRRDGDRLVCQRCAARASTTECVSCGQLRQTYRLVEGEPVCKKCARPPESAICAHCDRETTTWRQVDGVPCCLNCAPKALHQCVRCGQLRPMAANMLGGAHCLACRHFIIRNPRPCPMCGDPRILSELSSQLEAICATCAGIPSRFACRRCGSEAFHYGRICARCRLGDRIEEIIGSDPTDLPMVALAGRLKAVPNAFNAYRWMVRSKHLVLLSEIARDKQRRSHRTLDQATQDKALRYLRGLLIEVGALPPIDTRLHEFEVWLTAQLAHLTPAFRADVSPYANWVVLRRLRAAAARAPLTPGHVKHAKVILNGIVHFVTWLDSRDRDLTTMTQSDVDAYLSDHDAQRWMPPFLRWRRKAIGSRIWATAGPRATPAVTVTEQQRLDTAIAILGDESESVEIRLICQLVIVYGQPVSRVVAMTRSQITIGREEPRIRFGEHEIPLAPRIAALAHEYLADLEQEEEETDGWLFPGRFFRSHRSPQLIRRCLLKHGVNAREMQVAARFHVVSAMPHSVMADALGLSTATTRQYQSISGATWADAPAAFGAIHT